MVESQYFEELSCGRGRGADASSRRTQLKIPTQDVLVSMVDGWGKALDVEQTGWIRLDPSKASELVNHSILL